MPELTQESITRAVNESKSKHGRIVLADVQRDLGITRGRARTLQKDGFVLKPHGNKGKKKESKISGFEDSIKNDFLKQGVKNSDVIYQHIRELGFTGKLTIVKDFIKANIDLVPERRKTEVLPGRSRRYETEAGRMFQMDGVS